MTGGNPIIAGFRNVTRFSGRDRRGRFWPYAGVIFALLFMSMMVSMAISMATVFQDMSDFAAAHPDAAVVTSSPGHYSIQVDGSHPEAPTPNFSVTFTLFGIAVVAAVLLLAAAVCRRLHDAGRAGWWGLMPVPFLLTAVIGFPLMMNGLMAGDEPSMGLFMGLFFNNLIYMVALVTLVVLLVMPSKPGANKYGPPSV